MDTHEISLILDDLSMCCIDADESATQEKWLFIILLWLFTNRNNYSEPLKMVETIYEDFDYPEAIESLLHICLSVMAMILMLIAIGKILSDYLETGKLI